MPDFKIGETITEDEWVSVPNEQGMTTPMVLVEVPWPEGSKVRVTVELIDLPEKRQPKKLTDEEIAAIKARGLPARNLTG